MIDYAQLNYRYWRHHLRFQSFVAKHKLRCQECGGAGGAIEPVLDFGEGPFEQCGWCEGTGWMTPPGRGLWLGLKREKARKAA